VPTSPSCPDCGAPFRASALRDGHVARCEPCDRKFPVPIVPHGAGERPTTVRREPALAPPRGWSVTLDGDAVVLTRRWFSVWNALGAPLAAWLVAGFVGIAVSVLSRNDLHAGHMAVIGFFGIVVSAFVFRDVAHLVNRLIYTVRAEEWERGTPHSPIPAPDPPRRQPLRPSRRGAPSRCPTHERRRSPRLAHGSAPGPAC
jgi:hypothetical protein